MGMYRSKIAIGFFYVPQLMVGNPERLPNIRRAYCFNFRWSQLLLSVIPVLPTEHEADCYFLLRITVPAPNKPISNIMPGAMAWGA